MIKNIEEKRIRIRNKKLCKRYPFLIPRDRFTDKIPEDYDYSYTELDAMEPGWRKAFGLLMCEEIRNVLVRFNCLYKYRINQIKEKYARLCWYDSAPKNVMGEIFDIIWKYEYISGFTCQKCGKLDVPVLIDGWSMVICEDCYEKWRRKLSWMTPYSEAKKEKDEMMNYIIIEEHSIKNGKSEHEINITDTINKIRSGYHVKI